MLIIVNSVLTVPAGLQDTTDAVIATLQAIEHETISSQARTLVDACAYAGTGNVLKVQSLLRMCDEHLVKKDEKEDEKKEKKEGEEAEPEPPVKDDTFQGFAVIGIALVAMGEDIGSEMSMRQLSHLVSILDAIYEDVHSCFRVDAIRRASHPAGRTACPRPR